MLAHKAEEDAFAAVELMAGLAGHVDYDAVPGIVYTAPEVATLGKNEENLKAEGRSYAKGIFPFSGKQPGQGPSDIPMVCQNSGLRQN